ncbi:MAG TPA: site-specific integrase [Actinomycetota bacterium]|nr:site-specific integrase [Actinomycetota bacterium]
MTREHREGQTYAPETIHGFYDLLAAIFHSAVERDLIGRSPCRGIQLPQIIRQEKRYLSSDEVEGLVEATAPIYKTLVLVAAYLGLRWQEIAGLKRQAFTVRSGRLASVRVVSTIERSNGLYRPIEIGKTRAARRTLKVPEFLKQAIVVQLQNVPDESVWVFPAPQGGFLRYDNFMKRNWGPAVHQARLAPLTFHELRHTAAALMIDEGADPLQVKRRMGHEDIRTTLNTYGHLFPDREDDLVVALDARRNLARERHADSLRTEGPSRVVGLHAPLAADQGL